jgi:hypothetical protein
MPAAVQTVGAEPLGDGEHHLAVRHGREERGLQPLRPDRQPLGVTARTEVAASTREREQILVRARVAADAREPVLEHPAFEERVRDLRDHGPPRACALRDRGAPSIRSIGVRTITVVLRDGPFRRTIRVAEQPGT